MKNAEQPAFPESCTQEGYKANVSTGLTKREYFAAMAMQGLMAQGHDPENSSDLAKLAVEAADNLLARLEK